MKKAIYRFISKLAGSSVGIPPEFKKRQKKGKKPPSEPKLNWLETAFVQLVRLLCHETRANTIIREFGIKL